MCLRIDLILIRRWSLRQHNRSLVLHNNLSSAAALFNPSSCLNLDHGWIGWGGVAGEAYRTGRKLQFATFQHFRSLINQNDRKHGFVPERVCSSSSRRRNRTRKRGLLITFAPVRKFGEDKKFAVPKNGSKFTSWSASRGRKLNQKRLFLSCLCR